METVDFPLNLAVIAEKQETDDHLQNELLKPQPKYKQTTRDNTSIYVTSHTEEIYVPAPLRASILEWYHTTLQHPGIKRMQATLKRELLLAWYRRIR
jgi:hypothetical protein